MVRLFTRWRGDVVCRQAVALMSDYIEGALTPRQRARLERHLAACDGCDEYLRQLRLVVGLLGSAEPEDLSPEARQGLTEVWLEYRRDPEGEGDDGGGAEGGGRNT